MWTSPCDCGTGGGKGALVFWFQNYMGIQSPRASEGVQLRAVCKGGCARHINRELATLLGLGEMKISISIQHCTSIGWNY